MEKMIGFKKILDFEYDDIPYTMFIDKNHNYFFMKKGIDENYYYITLEEQKTLYNVFNRSPIMMNVENGKKYKIAPKIVTGALVASLSLGMLSDCTKKPELKAKDINNDEIITYAFEDGSSSTLNLSLDYVDFDEDTDDNDVDVYFELGTDIDIYDSSKLDVIFENKDITMDDFNNVIDNNDKISSRIKPFIKEFCKSYILYAPNADRRILYNNLSTLEVCECSTIELNLYSLSTDASACYNPFNNTIYVLKDYSFEKGTWSYQVIFHELCHAARNATVLKDGKEYKMKSSGLHCSLTVLDEMLNTLFSCSLLGYEEKDFAYQLQSNYMDCILDSLDNYEISDYINHSQSYFTNKIDEYMGEKGYSDTMLELINAQYQAHYDTHTKIRQRKLYPLYDAISEIYYKSRINSNTTYEEAVAIKDELVSRIMFDVPEDYNIKVEHFDDFLKDYCEELGIDVPHRGLF